MSHRKQFLALVAITMGVVAGCADPGTAPGRGRTAADVETARGEDAGTSATKSGHANAAADWNERATSLAARRPTNVARLYAYLSLAQLRAAEAAEDIRPHPSTSAAIGAASVAVLSSYYPLDVAEIESALAAQKSASRWPGAKHDDFAAGEAIGRAAGARVLAYSAGDGYGLTSPGVPPGGPGYWTADGRGIARGSFAARPFFLRRADEFRPSPPPAFNSPEYLEALAEVRHIADTRTPEQVAIASYWNLNQSGASNAVMNNLAVELLRRYRRKDVESARTLFLMNAASYDALVGCFDAKYHYWFIRPPQADPGIVTVFRAPPHPSYPSAHSCNSGASIAILSAKFPRETARLTDIATEASLSRLYAGIHYRFDMVAGLALGRAAAAKALATDLEDVAVR